MIVIAFLQNLYKKLVGIGFNTFTDSLKAIADMLRKLINTGCPNGVYFDADSVIRTTIVGYSGNGIQQPESYIYNSHPLPPKKTMKRILPSSYITIDMSEANLKSLRDIWIKHITLSSANPTNVDNTDPIEGIGFNFEFLNSSGLFQPTDIKFINYSSPRANDYTHDTIANDSIVFDKAQATSCDITVDDIGKYLYCVPASGHLNPLNNVIRKIESVSISGDIVTVTFNDGKTWLTPDEDLTNEASNAVWQILEEETEDIKKKLLIFEMPSAEAAKVRLKISLRKLQGYEDISLPDYESVLTFQNMSYNWNVGLVTGEADSDFKMMELVPVANGLPKIKIKTSPNNTDLIYRVSQLSIDAFKNKDNDLAYTIHTGQFGRQFDNMIDKIQLLKVFREKDSDWLKNFNSPEEFMSVYGSCPLSVSLSTANRKLFFDLAEYPYDSISENIVPIYLREFKKATKSIFIAANVVINSDESAKLAGTTDGESITLLAYDQESDSLINPENISGISSVERHSETATLSNGLIDTRIRFKITFENDKVQSSNLLDNYTFAIAKTALSGANYNIISKINIDIAPALMIFPSELPDSNGIISDTESVIKKYFDNTGSKLQFANNAYNPGIISSVIFEDSDYNSSINYATTPVDVNPTSLFYKKIVRARPVGGESYSIKVIIDGIEQSILDSIDSATNITAYMKDMNVVNGTKIYADSISSLTEMNFKNIMLGEASASTKKYVTVTFNADTMHSIASTFGAGTLFVMELLDENSNIVSTASTLVYIPPIINLEDTFTNITYNDTSIQSNTYGSSWLWRRYRQKSTNDYFGYGLYASDSNVASVDGPLSINGYYLQRVLKSYHANFDYVDPRPEELWNMLCDNRTPTTYTIKYCTSYPSITVSGTTAATLSMITVNGAITRYGKHKLVFLPGAFIAGLQPAILDWYNRPNDMVDVLVINSHTQNFVNGGYRTDRQWTQGSNSGEKLIYIDDPEPGNPYTDSSSES